MIEWLPAAASVFNGILSAQGQSDTNAMNQQNALAQMDFQERMSSTAHQREVKDLIKAGLNPMLSSMRGGATTPPGAMATMGNPAAAGTSSAAQAMQAAATYATIDKTKAEADLIRSQIPEAEQRIKTGASTAQHLDTQVENIKQEMTAFTDRWQKIKEEVEQIKATQRKTDSQTDLNVQLHERIRPAELAKLRAEALKLTAETKALGLKVPEQLREAAFWTSDQGALGVHYRHAPGMNKFIPGTITKGAEELRDIGDSVARGVNSAASGAHKWWNEGKERRFQLRLR